MSSKLNLSTIISELDKRFLEMPDYRKENNNMKYSIQDAAKAAFSVFFTQSPSFLSHQQSLQKTKGSNNAKTVFSVEQIPCDNQIRSLLDPVCADYLYPVFDWIYNQLFDDGNLDSFRSELGYLRVALDGTQYFSSNSIHCQNCLTKTHNDGSITYFHQVITPVIVAPNHSEVISLCPEFILSHDGKEKQDSERTAAKRWIEHNQTLTQTGPITILGDELYCNHPLCSLLQSNGFDFIFVCTFDSHKTLYSWLQARENRGEIKTIVQKVWNGTFREIHTYRYVNRLPLRDSDDTLWVNWCELTITHAKDKTVLYHNTWATNHLLEKKNVKIIVRDARSRWKVENENNNILKTKGYHLEHNYGHGKQHLSTLLLTMNLLAFLIHTVFELIDQRYQALRKALGARKNFFNDIRALTRYLIFQSWDHLLEFMIQQLELKINPDPG